MLNQDIMQDVLQYVGYPRKLDKLKSIKCFEINYTHITYWKGMPRYDLPNLKVLDCSELRLITLKVPEGIRKLECCQNKLTFLKVPKGIIELDCSDNLLTVLKVPEGIETLYYSGNNLTKITYF